MSTPALKARAERETLQVLNPFLEVLRSPADIKIPRETLVGALGHFLSSLEGDRLDSFIQDILASPSLWKTLDSAEIQAAVRPAPAAKVAALRPEVKDGWILRNQLPKACEAWLKEVVKAVTRSGLTTNCLVVLIGLLQGIDDVPDIDWGKARVDLEEEIVIALGERFEKNNCDALDLFSSVAEHIDDNRLRALDLRQVIPRLNVELFTAIGFPPPPAPAAFPVKTLDMDQLSLVSRGLARSFLAMSEGSSQSQQYAWEELEAFVRRMFDCAAKLQDEFGDYEPRKGGAEWERQKAALLAFITVAWPGVVIMLNPHRHPSQQQSIKLSMLLVLTLAKFASLTQSEGTMEGYEKLLYGSLDVLAAEGGPRGVRSLFAELWHEKRSSQLAAFGLLVAEQLIHLVDAATIRDKVMPLAAKYFVRPEHRTAFEASHAFVLVLLDVASNTLDKDSTQAHFVEAMVKICAQGLLKDARHGSVTSAQLLPAFTAVVRAAARYDTVLVAYCVEQLDSADFDSQEYVTAVNMIRISIIPSIPQPDMAKYLDSVATVILAAPQGSEARLELAAHAFKVIMNDIPDETRQEGLDWWLKYRRVFQSQKEMRARL